MKHKVYVGMSGGVDSSVTAKLLVDQGYDVTGVFMQCFYPKECRGCLNQEDINDAREVCRKLNIPFMVYDFQKEARPIVVDGTIEKFELGLTPNPEVVCNKEVKFGLLLRKVLADGAEYFATGHYLVKQKETRDKKSPQGGFRLFEGVDKSKDQSYFLHRLNQKQLSRVLFPLGEFKKMEVREMAKEFGLHNHEKKDSQGLCFTGNLSLSDYIRNEIDIQKGYVVDLKENSIGKHDGVSFYTIGQKLNFNGNDYYIIIKDIRNNKLYVTIKPDDRCLFRRELIARDVNWISGYFRKTGGKNYLSCHARIRYHHPAEKCRVYGLKEKDQFKVIFETSQRAVTPGQSIVFYKKRRNYKTMEMLGGGEII